MKIYADTSFLLRLLVRDQDTEGAIAAHRRLGRPNLMFTTFHEVEATNALRLRTFMASNGTGATTKRRALRDEKEGLQRLRNAVATGRFHTTSMPWDATCARARSLSESHCHRLGVRSFDLLHVAAAVELLAKEFITCDLRQAALAKAAGLKVHVVHRDG